MSKLEELLRQYCPNGVNQRSIGSLIHKESLKAKNDLTVTQVMAVSNSMGIIPNTDYRDRDLSSDDTSNYTIVRQGMFAYNPSRLNVGSFNWNRNTIDGLVSPMYVVFSVDAQHILPEYLYLVMTSSEVRKGINRWKEEGARFRFDFENWDRIEIPVPPLPVQQEIIRILDNCSDYTGALIKELQSELVLLSEQRKYYLNRLVTFSTHYTTKVLRDVIKVRMCKRIKKEQTIEKGGIPFYKNGTLGKVADSFIPVELYEEFKSKYAFPKKGAVMLSTAGTVGRAYIYDGEPAYFQDSNVIWLENDESEVTNEYLYWFCVSMPWKLPSRGTISHLHNDMIYDTSIVIPPKDIQQESVRLLKSAIDKYDRLKSCLTAEIVNRQKQYDYYRDKLLSFEPLT